MTTVGRGVVFLKTMGLLLRAALLRRRSATGLRLPTLSCTPGNAGLLRFSKKDINLLLQGQSTLINQVNRITMQVAGKSRHACLYRCYPLAVLLRERGMPVQFNIGLMGLQPRQELRGHCWLSLHGQIFNEPEEASSRSYPEFLGQGGEGIFYWVNTDADGVIRSKSET